MTVLDTIRRAQAAQRAYYRRTHVQLALDEEEPSMSWMDAEPMEPIPPGHCEGGGPSFMDEDYADMHESGQMRLGVPGEQRPLLPLPDDEISDPRDEMPPGWFQPDGMPHETISEQVDALRRAGAYKRN